MKKTKADQAYEERARKQQLEAKAQAAEAANRTRTIFLRSQETLSR